MAAHIGDPRLKPGGRVKGHGNQVRRKFDMDLVKVQKIAEGFGFGGGHFDTGFVNRRGRFSRGPPGGIAQTAGPQHKGNKGQAWHDGE